ncbi:MAG: hypothetical protein IPH58_16685 [Sphingobacteriales bacterium]|nr:hypothetical protein [Sphingobacteriales bacterium]
MQIASHEPLRHNSNGVALITTEGVSHADAYHSLPSGMRLSNIRGSILLLPTNNADLYQSKQLCFGWL